MTIKTEINIRRYYNDSQLILTAVYLGYFSIVPCNPQHYYAVSSPIQAYSLARVKGTSGIYHSPQTLAGCEKIFDELVHFDGPIV